MPSCSPIMALYSIDLEPRAERELRGIGDIEQANEVLEAFRTIADDPHKGIRNPNLDASYVLLAGDHWLIYFVDEEQLSVRIVSVVRT